MKKSAIAQEYFRWTLPTFAATDVTLELYQATVGSALQRRFPVDPQYCSRLGPAYFRI